MTLRRRIEAGFERWGAFVFERRWWVVSLVLLATAGIVPQLGELRIDTSTEGELHPDDPIRLEYDAFREQFGRDQRIMLSVEPPEVFDRAFLLQLERFHRELESGVPKLDDIDSLVNARLTLGREQELIVRDLLEEQPRDDAELAELRELVMSSPTYRDLTISADGKLTTVVIETDAYSSIGYEEDALAGFDDAEPEIPGPRPFITGEENAEIIAAVQAIIERYDSPDFPVRAAGDVLLPDALQKAMLREMPRFSLAALGVIVLLLSLLFRRVAGVLLPLTVAVLSTLVALSGMAGLGTRIQLTIQILPSFLLAVGIGYSVHLLTAFFQRFDAGTPRREALEKALGHAGLPIALTGLTTGVGVLSFTSAELVPITQFGAAAAGGVALAFAYALTLLPALVAIVPLRPRPGGDGTEIFNAGLRACGRLAVHYPRSIAAATALLIAVSALLATGLRFSANPLLYLPEGHPMRVNTEYLDQRLGGSMGFEVWIETGRENGLYEPEVMNRIDALNRRVAEYAAEGEQLGRTVSVVDVVKETHQALNENRPEFYAIPQQRRLLAQEMLLFENSGSDDLERLADSKLSQARFSVRAAWIDPVKRAPLLIRAQREFSEILGEHAEVTLTGLINIMSRTVSATVESLARSYLLAFALITPLMMLLIGSLRSGLVSMVPNLVPIAATLALMALLDIPLDVFTLLIGCIALGLAVDDTIHFIHTFRRYLALSGDPEEAVDRTLQTTGRALLFTTLVLTGGFSMFLLSSMANLKAFGLLTSFAISAAFVLDVLATPALLVLVSRRRRAGAA